MRIANLKSRLVIVTEDGTVDVERASGGRFGPDPQAVYDRWAEFKDWATGTDLENAEPFTVEDLGAPVPAPRQVFAIGLNYSKHAAESGFAVPDAPTVMFTKWQSCLTGPVTEVELPEGGHTDWEVELVVVIGERARDVTEAAAWGHVAGLTVGQDLSERVQQTAGPSPQFSLGKSLPGFGPTGPWLVTPDELADRDDLELGCAINGEQVQKGRTRELIFSVPALVSKLSAKVPLLPGDLLFTGTPAGVGMGRTPPRFLAPGDELVSSITGIGELRQRFVAAPTAKG
ncbi:fumarylacetoacetate hydrolase family protein [Dactylosporangium siamense]|uniref:Fumarylacetoacetate hydrolase n=1 Tax=Dactylosporangium siamense TaxID=685454 RepID=A0A919U9R1_9ACTN|nr:fumarylacetoacetate hydrolase family protein [Dactylosporangium siamense]GIG44005.1 fumarylacetoacetate hydrolase [Dactylosporangium siamense]